MQKFLSDGIYAVASMPLSWLQQHSSKQVPICVIRISGSQQKIVQECLPYLFREKQKEIKPNFQYRVLLRNENELIDDCMMVYFKEPSSFT